MSIFKAQALSYVYTLVIQSLCVTTYIKNAYSRYVVVNNVCRKQVYVYDMETDLSKTTWDFCVVSETYLS